LRGRPAVTLSLGWRRLKRAIKQSERLWSVAVRVRGALASLRK